MPFIKFAHPAGGVPDSKPCVIIVVVPPLAVSVVVAPMHIEVVDGVTVTADGAALTVTVTDDGTVQLPVGVTEYTVVVVGDTVIDAVVAEVLQVYPVPPEAVIVVGVPEHMVGADGEKVIHGVTTAST